MTHVATKIADLLHQDDEFVRRNGAHEKARAKYDAADLVISYLMETDEPARGDVFLELRDLCLRLCRCLFFLPDDGAIDMLAYIEDWLLRELQRLANVQGSKFLSEASFVPNRCRQALGAEIERRRRKLHVVVPDKDGQPKQVRRVVPLTPVTNGSKPAVRPRVSPEVVQGFLALHEHKLRAVLAQNEYTTLDALLAGYCAGEVQVGRAMGDLSRIVAAREGIGPRQAATRISSLREAMKHLVSTGDRTARHLAELFSPDARQSGRSACKAGAE